jgi:DNA-binding MarR family transcriptional regulator
MGKLSMDIALDRQRLKALETPEHPQPTQKDRADALLLMLAASNGKMLAKDARHKLGVSKSLFSQLVRSLRGQVEVRPLHTDRRQHVISLIKLLTIETV